MSAGSAIFKVFASLVWGIGTAYVIASMKTEGAGGGWWDLLLTLGLLGILQGFSFVSCIMAAFHRGAEESANTVEETVWLDQFGNVVRRETDAGSGCIIAVFLWGLGIMLTLLASALIAPLIFVVNLCRAAHRFLPTGVAIILDLLIIFGTGCGTFVAYDIADKAIEERAARRQVEAAQYRKEADAKAAAARAERDAQMERDRQAREAEQSRLQAERNAQEAQRQAERQAKELQRQQERAQREARTQQRRAQQQADRERRAAEAEQRRIQQRMEREQRNHFRNQSRPAPRMPRMPKNGQKFRVPF